MTAEELTFEILDRRKIVMKEKDYWSCFEVNEREEAGWCRGMNEGGNEGKRDGDESGDDIRGGDGDADGDEVRDEDEVGMKMEKMMDMVMQME